MKIIQTQETPEIRKLRAQVEIHRADMEIAERELIEAMKAQWMHAPLWFVKDFAKNEAVAVLAVCDWVDGAFQYQMDAKPISDNVVFGGYVDNDRLRGASYCYIPRNAYTERALVLWKQRNPEWAQIIAVEQMVKARP